MSVDTTELRKLAEAALNEWSRIDLNETAADMDEKGNLLAAALRQTLAAAVVAEGKITRALEELDAHPIAGGPAERLRAILTEGDPE